MDRRVHRAGAVVRLLPRLVCLAALALLAAGCDDSNTTPPAASPTATPTAVAPTATPTHTAVPPTATASPTRTPTSTAVPSATPTLPPTATATPPPSATATATATATPPVRFAASILQPAADRLELAASVPVEVRFDTQTAPVAVTATVDGTPVALTVDAPGGSATGKATGLAGGSHVLTVRVDYGDDVQEATRTFTAIALDNPDQCDVINNAACLLPYPSSHFLEPADTATGFRLAFPQAGMPAQRNLRMPVEPYQRMDGFSPTVGITMHFPNGVDPEKSNAARILEASRTHDERSLDADSPTLLFDAGTGEQILHFIEVEARAAINNRIDRELLLMNAAQSLPPGRRYIVAMRNLVDRNGAPVVAEPGFAALRDGTPSNIPGLEARRATLEPVFARLAELGVERSELVLAFDFVVASDESLTGEMLHMRDDAFAWLAGRAGEQTFTVDRVVENDCDRPGTRVWRRVEGTFQVPLYLQADPLLLPETAATFRRDANDMPLAEGVTNPPYTIAIPCTIFDPDFEVTPPIVLGHGLFGEGRDVLEDLTGTPEIDALPYIAGATDFTGLAALDSGGGDNIPSSFVGKVALDQPRNFPALADRLRQGQLNTLVLARLMKTGAFNADPAFQVAGGAGVFPGPEVEQFYFGASLGGIMGLMFAALSPDVERVLVNVPGINFSLLLPRSVAFLAFEAAIRLTGVTDPIQQRLLVLLTHELWVRGESAGYATHVTRDPLPGSNVKQVLMTAALYDQLVSNLATELAARTLGLPSLEGSILPNRPGMPDVAGPVPSAVQFYDAGTFDPNDPVQSSFIPPLTNVQPVVNRCDPHGRQAFIPAAIDQLFEFLRPGGVVRSFCDGACDAAIPYEQPFNGARPCNPFG